MKCDNYECNNKASYKLKSIIIKLYKCRKHYLNLAKESNCYYSKKDFKKMKLQEADK